MTTYKWGKFSIKNVTKTEKIFVATYRGTNNNYPNDRPKGTVARYDARLNQSTRLFETYRDGDKLTSASGAGTAVLFYEGGSFAIKDDSFFRERDGNDRYVGNHYTFAEKSGRFMVDISGWGSSATWDIYEARNTIYPLKDVKVGTVTSTNRRAYPDNGKSGSYWYVYEGIANQEPTISGQDEDWGGYKQAFKRYYSVDDGDSGQQLNVVVTLNGVTIATVNNATRKTDYPIDIDDSKFNALNLNEQNTIEITVTDSSGATAVRRYTFKRINTAPVVTMTNAHYGEQNKPFTINFEAADPDGDEITAKLFIDDVQIKDLGTINGKQSVTIPKIDFAKIPNGEHRIRVEAKDSYNAVGAGYADFSKNLTYAWYRLKKELSEQPSAVIVNPLAELAPGANMTIKVCSNVVDAQPTWETVPEELYGQKYNFRNTSKTSAKWGVGVEIRIDKEKATEESYLYGFVGAYM